MFSVFGVEGQVICCKGSQCGDYHDSWPSSSHHPGEATGEVEATGLQQQQAIVKYPPCQPSNTAIRHRIETTAIIVITILYF